MKILAIDTSGPNCSVSILENNSVLGDFTIHNGITHSQNLVPMIEQVQRFTNLDLNDIDIFACSIGPGSFTGLRIGLATIKGFAISLQKKVIGVPTLLSLAYNVSQFNGTICALLDARNNNVYAGLYRKQDDHKINLIGDYISDSIDTLIQAIKQQDSAIPILFVGDGVEVYKEKLINELTSPLENHYTLSFAPAHQNGQYALSVARAANDMASCNEFSDYHSLTPLYLKKSQAERMLETKKEG